MIGFRQNSNKPIVSIIHGKDIQIVNTCKCLEKKKLFCHLMQNYQCLCCDTILCNFLSIFQSIFTFSCICWLNVLPVKDKQSLNAIVKACYTISGTQERDLGSLGETGGPESKNSYQPPQHVLYSEFTFWLAPLGKQTAQGST